MSKGKPKKRVKLKSKKASNPSFLNWGVLLFLYLRLILGIVILFAGYKMDLESPYKEIVILLGVTTTLTSGIKVTFSNWFEKWDNTKS